MLKVFKLVLQAVFIIPYAFVCIWFTANLKVCEMFSECWDWLNE